MDAAWDRATDRLTGSVRRGRRALAAPAAAVVLALSLLATTLAATAGAEGETAPAVDLASAVVSGAPLPASEAPPSPEVAATSVDVTTSVDYPKPSNCPPDVDDSSCLRTSNYATVTLSSDQVENGGDLRLTVQGTLPPCGIFKAPYRDCWNTQNTYMGAGYRVLPTGTFPSVGLQYGTDGVLCYQYVASCQFSTSYAGELPSRWIVVTGVAFQITADPPPPGLDFARIVTAEGAAYSWYVRVDAAYRVLGANPQPTADFTVTPVDGQPGTYDYASTSTNPNGTGLAHTWTFPDGTTSTQPSVRKAYTTPGDKEVTLSVRTPEGLTASKARTVEVAAPTLGIEIEVDGDPPGLEEGDEAEVAVVVTASDDGVGDLTGLALGEDLLTTSDPETLEITEAIGPAADDPFTLAPGASKRFAGKVTAKQAGTADLTASVAGEDAIGREVADDVARQVRIRSQALALELTLDRDELTLEEDAEGPTPEEITLTVKGTNRSEQDLTDITLLSILPSWQTGLPFTSVLPSSILRPLDGPGPDGLPVDDLAPGESFEQEFRVEVRDDGHLRLGIDATYASAAGTELATGDVDLMSKPKYLLTFEASADASVDDNPADPWNPPDAVEAGRSFLVLGSMKNLTTDQKVIATVPAGARDQVSSVNLGKLEEDWDNPGMPFRIDLDPGSSQGVKASPVAVPVPAKNGVLTFAELTYEPSGRARLRDDDDPTTLTAEQILSPVELRSAKVPIVWPPAEPAPTPIEFYGLFTKAFIESTAAWWADASSSAGKALYAVGEMEFQAWALITDPVARERARQQLTGAWASFVHNVDLMRQTIETLTPAQRLLLIQEISNPFLLYLKIGRSVVTSEQAQAAAQAIGKAIDAAWTRITTLGGEDPRELARILGSGSATVFNEVTVGMVTDAAIAKLFTRIRYGSNLAEAQRFVDEAAAAKVAEGLRIDKGLKGIPAGAVLTDKILTIALGITKAEKEQLLAVAKRFNLNIMARSRGAGAAELLAKGRARLKPFGVDAKNVNDIDVLLGFPASMKDTVAIKKPKAWADVLASGEYRALDAEQRAQVASRWQTRSKEWNGGGKLKESSPGEWTVAEAPPDAIGAERKKFEAAAEKGTFDLQFPTEGNWEEIAVDKQALGTARADFSLKRTVGPDGEEVLQPYLSASKGGEPLPITGDVDLVALLNPDGTYPDPAKIIAAYQELAKPPLGMQHPATWSFNVQGKSMDLLSDHVLGGATAEPLAAFDPTGKITAVLFDPKMSLIPADRAANPALLLKVAGGIKLPSHAYGLGAVLPIFVETQADPQRNYYLPEAWREAQARGAGGSGTRSLALPSAAPASTAGVQYLRGAPPVEEADDGGLVRLGATWAAWSSLPTGKLPIAPQTCIVGGLAAGDRTASVYSLDQLFSTTGTGGQQWFAVGDRVTIDPRGAAPWTTTVVAVTSRSITFADGAPTDYLQGTSLHLLPKATSGGGGDGGDGGGGGTGGGADDDGGAGSGAGAGGGGGGGSGGAPETGDDGELARTGSDAPSLALLGVLVVVLGAAVLALESRSDRRREAHAAASGRTWQRVPVAGPGGSRAHPSPRRGRRRGRAV